MTAASAAASDLQLLSDGSWPGYTRQPFQVMEGYTQMGCEIAQQYEGAPTHIFLQAGVGGLAAARAAIGDIDATTDVLCIVSEGPVA